MATGPKSGWGGARPNSGPQKQTLTARRVEKILSALGKVAKRNGGTDLEELYAQVAYGEGQFAEWPPATRERAMANLLNMTMAPLKEGGETDRAGPAVFLPERRPDVTPIKKDEAA